MPEMVENMAQQLGQVSEQMKLFGEGMREHMKLISTLQEVAFAMKDASKWFSVSSSEKS
jgi:hypothetical protein